MFFKKKLKECEFLSFVNWIGYFMIEKYNI